MRLTVFGATGRTGQLLVDQALSASHYVTVLVRDPSRVITQNSHLTVLAGSIQNTSQVEQAITGSEAVISVLGPIVNKPTYEVSAATETIITAMKKLGVRRLIVSTGAGVADPKDAPAVFNHFMNFLVKWFARYVFEDMQRVVARVRLSELDWTIVRVPMLTDGPHTGLIQAGYVGKGIGPRISRADLADFMLKQAADLTWLLKAPVISNLSGK